MLKKDPKVLFNGAALPTENDAKRSKAILIVAPLAALVHLLLIPFFFFAGIDILAWVNVGSVLIWGVGLWLSCHDKVNLSIQIFAVEILAHSLLVCYFLGSAPGFQYYLWAIAALCVMDTSASLLRVCVTSFTLILIFAVLNAGFFEPLYPFPFPEYLLYMNLANILVAGVISTLAIIIMRNFHLSRERVLKKQAARDSLTGLYNRREGLLLLEQSCLNAARNNEPLSVVMADVDYFKKINDCFGHSVGDDVLCQIADQLADSIRRSDIAIRWGGEEFLILFPAASMAAVQEILNATRLHFAKSDLIESLLGKPVTLSFGIAQMLPGESIQQVIARADEALYSSKKMGRDQITIAKNRQVDSSVTSDDR